MHDLQISIKGEITSSNFEEWKNTILQRIDATSTELVTDEDFASADGTVKSYKLIEKRLDEVKQSALDQSKDITDLFDAIDSVKSRVRDVRLTLYRQVNQKKKEIRLDLIAAAISKVRSCIKEKTGVFPLLDHSDLLRDWDYESAIKGKSSLHRAKAALDQLVQGKSKDIESRVAQVMFNEAQIEKVSEEYGFLFHDKKSILLKPRDKLAVLIQERIDDYKKQEAAKGEVERKKVEQEAAEREAKRQSEEQEAAKREAERKRVEQEAAERDAECQSEANQPAVLERCVNLPPATPVSPMEEPVSRTTLPQHHGDFIADLKTLAKGSNPITSQKLEKSSVINEVDTVRLLYLIIEELESTSTRN